MVAETNPTDTTTLSDHDPGSGELEVRGLDEGAAASLRARLMALGFVPGTRVRVRRRAPLGDPTEYEVRGARVSLRAREARVIQVRPLAQGGDDG